MSLNSLDLIILKNIISNKKHAIEFANDCDLKLFSPELFNTANVILGYVKTYKDIPTLNIITERLAKNTKLIESITNVWNQAEQTIIDPKEFKHNLEKIKQRYAEKQLIAAKEAMNKLEFGSIDVNKSLTELQKTIQNIKSLEINKAYENKSIKEYLPTFVDRFNAKKNDPTVDKGLMTGYSFFDYATNGLKPADFVLIAGESGFGKSLLLNNMAVQIWMQKNKIDFTTKQDFKNFTGGKDLIYFSLEMPYEDCFNRLISRLSGVPTRNIENASLTKEEFSKIKICLDFIKEYPYQFRIVDLVDPCANDLEAILEDLDEKFDAIFIDYLGIMTSNEKNKEEQDWQRQGSISYQIRRIARRYKLPIFSAVQLNRKAQGKEPSENIGLNRLARSATIATHATHVLQIESRPSEEKHCDLITWLIKNRKGPKGKGILIKDLACATLLDKEDEQIENIQAYQSPFKNQDDISEQIENLEL